MERSGRPRALDLPPLTTDNGIQNQNTALGREVPPYPHQPMENVQMYPPPPYQYIYGQHPSYHSQGWRYQPNPSTGYPVPGCMRQEHRFPPVDQLMHPTVTQGQWNQLNCSMGQPAAWPCTQPDLKHPMETAPTSPKPHHNQPQYSHLYPSTRSQESTQMPIKPLKAKQSTFGANRAHPFLTPGSSGYSSMANSGLNTPIRGRSRSRTVSCVQSEAEMTKEDLRREQNNECDKRRRANDDNEILWLENQNAILKKDQEDEDAKIQKRRVDNTAAKRRSRARKKEKLEMLRKEHDLLLQERATFLALVEELTKELENRRIEELRKNLNESAMITGRHEQIVLNLMKQVSAELSKGE